MTHQTSRSSLSSSQKADAKLQKKALWKKPQLTQLQISLDTAFMNGSGSDGTRGSMP